MKGTVHILDRSGDTPLEYDTEIERQVSNGPLPQAEVERRFQAMINQGNLVFATSEAQESVQLRRGSDWVPEEHPKVTISPAFQGG